MSTYFITTSVFSHLASLALFLSAECLSPGAHRLSQLPTLRCESGLVTELGLVRELGETVKL